MSQSIFVGVDGCPAGWFSVALDVNGSLVRCGVFDSFGGLLESNSDAELVLVDMPIGLTAASEGRLCDRAARKKLKLRASSVFRSPTREAVLEASSTCDYQAASDVEYQFAGKRLTRQTYNIARKIAQVDYALACRAADARPKVREVHPEVCFWTLNNCRPMACNKKKPGGQEERVRVLKCYLEEAPNVYNGLAKAYPRSHVARDDILDALAAAVTGWLGMTGRGRLATIPAQPPRDSRGLPMEMVYCEPHSQTVSDRT